MRRLIVVVFVLGLWLVASAVVAQTVVINPTTVQMTASADHNAVVPGSNPPVPLLDHYELEIVQQGQATPMRVVSLGKPTPDGANQISVTNAAHFDVPTGAYICYVTAIGYGGVGRSEASAVWFSIKEAPAAPGKPLMRGESPPGVPSGALVASALSGV